MKERVKKQMLEDAGHKNMVMEWLRDSKIAKAGVITAAIAATLGLGKMASSVAHNESRKNIPESLVKHNPETPLMTESEYNEPTAEPEFKAEPESDFEKEMQEAEEEYWRLVSGESTRGNAGTDKHYGEPGQGAPQLSEEDWQKIGEAYQQVGQGMSMEEADELGYQLAEKAGLSRDQYQQLQDAIHQQIESSQQIKGLQKANKDGKTSIAWAMSVALRDGGAQR